MAVYVDHAQLRFGRMKMSHLIADSLAELHWFAGRLGLKRAWFQDGRHPHYDMSEMKRREALDNGAVPVGTRQLINISQKIKGES